MKNIASDFQTYLTQMSLLICALLTGTVLMHFIRKHIAYSDLNVQKKNYEYFQNALNNTFPLSDKSVVMSH